MVYYNTFEDASAAPPAELAAKLAPGSHPCFYGDATILSASATGCNNMVHVLTQLPYALIAGIISTLLYLVLGFYW